MAPETYEGFRCEAHEALVADAATEREARRHLERQDLQTAGEVKELGRKVEIIDKRLSQYGGAIMVLVFLVPIAIKIITSLWPVAESTAHAATP